MAATVRAGICATVNALIPVDVSATICAAVKPATAVLVRAAMAARPADVLLSPAAAAVVSAAV
jgi:hypothetical protein